METRPDSSHDSGGISGRWVNITEALITKSSGNVVGPQEGRQQVTLGIAIARFVPQDITGTAGAWVHLIVNTMMNFVPDPLKQAWAIGVAWLRAIRWARSRMVGLGQSMISLGCR